MKNTVFIILFIFLTECSMFGIILANNFIQEYENLFNKKNMGVSVYLLVMIALWYLLIRNFIYW